MAQDEYTFPQDHGTGTAYSGDEGDKGDANDAARLGSLVGATKPVSCLLRGCTFSNVGSGSFDIDAGKFYAVADSLGVASGSEDRDEVGHVNGYSGDTGVSYTDNDVNYVFLEADLDQKEVITPVVNTNNTAPSGPSVKIGEIDATTSPVTTSEQWNLLAEDGTLSYPDADAANTSLNNFDASVTVYDRTNNTLISDSGVSVPTLEAESATVNGTADVVELLADTLAGADLANASENQILVTQGDGTLTVETQAQGPNPYNQAKSFGEADVSVSTTQSIIKNGSIKLNNINQGSLTFDPRAEYIQTIDSASGGVIDVNSEINNLTLRLSGKGTSASNFDASGGDFVIYDSNDNVVASKSAVGYSEYDYVEFSTTLQPDRYTIVLDNFSGSAEIPNITNGTLNTDGTSINYVDSYLNGTQGGDKEYLFYIYEGKKRRKSGSATIEWDAGIPTDIFEWDVATFTRTLDNETVDVFVAYSSDGGATWTRTNSGNPITRNYSLQDDPNITPNVDVRIETELSRADTANNPTLDSCYRSWLV